MLKKFKFEILKLPVQGDQQIGVAALKVVNTMVGLGLVKQDNIQTLLFLVHSPSQSILSEMAQLLLVLFSQEDHEHEEEKRESKGRQSLFLEFEKLKENQDEEQKLNFNQEAAKSTQQLVKLVKLARKIPTRKMFLQFKQSEDPVQEIEDHLRLEHRNE